MRFPWAGKSWYKEPILNAITIAKRDLGRIVETENSSHYRRTGLERVSVDKSIELAREAYVRMAEKKTTTPERVWLTTIHATSVYCMPAHLHGHNSVAVKIARQNPRNPANFLPSVLATIYVFDSNTGQELAQIEADTLTALRTAASSAITTDLLASKSATPLGIFGIVASSMRMCKTLGRN